MPRKIRRLVDQLLSVRARRTSIHSQMLLYSDLIQRLLAMRLYLSRWASDILSSIANHKIKDALFITKYYMVLAVKVWRNGIETLR